MQLLAIRKVYKKLVAMQFSGHAFHLPFLKGGRGLKIILPKSLPQIASFLLSNFKLFMRAAQQSHAE